MTEPRDRQPPSDKRAQDRETVEITAGNVSRPAAAAAGSPGSVVLLEEPLSTSGSAADLTYESGVELKARSQWAYARIRFFRHRLAVVSLIVLLGFGLVAIFADRIAPYGYDEATFELDSLNRAPTLDGWHLLGTDQLGRDYLSRVIYGVRTSLWVALFVATLSTMFGTAVGAIAGYYGGKVDNLLMRFTDLVLTLPGLAVLIVAAAFFGSGDPLKVGVILAFLFWTAIARIVRGVFLSLREKEFVEAAKAAGARDSRIIIRHMLPNCVGPIVVNATLVIATAIIVESALSFLGFGIQPPDAALGKLIADGQSEGFRLWWLVTFPGLVIVVLALAVNFIGDGLRDALDPTQKRVRA